jgi:tetratricopeptide (TPR) repeat protein
MPPALATLLVGVLFLGSFTGLSVLRRQRPSVRFVVEGGVLTLVAVGLSLAGAPLHPILFLVVLYLLTMRVRVLVDAANVLTNRGRYRGALKVLDFALRLGPDPASRQIALINRGVTQLRMGEPEAAYFTIKGVLLDEELKPAAHYQAAGFYNLGVACLRSKRPQEAERYFRKTIEVMPGSLYAIGAEKALKRASQGNRGSRTAQQD